MSLIRSIKHGFLPLVLVTGVVVLPGSARLEHAGVQAAAPSMTGETAAAGSWTMARIAHLEADIGSPLPSTIRELLDFANIPADVDKQHYCLAQAIYHEARGESINGQFAVARVILNRVADTRYPDTICGVVFQNRHWVDACQFSFACDALPDSQKEEAAWAMSRRIANLARADFLPDTSGAATHYHATHVQPDWSARLKQTAHVGKHIFYRYHDAE